jgi:hypothetical protein
MPNYKQKWVKLKGKDNYVPFKVPVDPVQEAIEKAVNDIGKATKGKGYDDGSRS